MILVKVLALSEYIGHSALASFFRGVIFQMDSYRIITNILSLARDVIARDVMMAPNPAEQSLFTAVIWLICPLL